MKDYETAALTVALMVPIAAIEMVVMWEEFEVPELEHCSVFLPVDVMDPCLAQ